MEGSAYDGAVPELENYEYPCGFNHRDRGAHLANRALERHRRDYRLGEGQSDQSALVSGHFLPLREHPNEEWNDLWLLTEVRHEGRQPQGLEESAHALQNKGDFHQGYRNTFLATHGKRPIVLPCIIPSQEYLAARQLWSLAPKIRKYTATGTVGSKCSFIGIARAGQ